MTVVGFSSTLLSASTPVQLHKPMNYTWLFHVTKGHIYTHRKGKIETHIGKLDQKVPILWDP